MSASNRPASGATASQSVVNAPAPDAGQLLAGARLVKRLSSETDRQVWRAELSGTMVSVCAFTGDPRSETARRFREGAQTLLDLTLRSPIPGVLRVHTLSEDGLAYAADLWTVGSVANLSALGWGLEPRIDLLRQVCSALEQLHALGIPHGCLLPSNILLDDDLRPVLSDIGLHDPRELANDPATRAYVPSELAAGEAFSTATEVFVLGQLLQMLLLDADPPPEYADLPKLETIAAIAPAGLVRIARKCLLARADQRYGSVAELVIELARFEEFETVGLPHPDVREADVPVSRYVSPAARSSLTPQPPQPPSSKTGANKAINKTGANKAIPKEIRQPSAPSMESAYAAREPAEVKARPTWIVLGWLGALIVTLGSGFLGVQMGSLEIVWRVLAAIGFGAFVALTPAGGAAFKVRGALAVVFFAVGFAVDGAAVLREGSAADRFASSDPHMVVSAVRDLRKQGRVDFRNIVMRGGDLRGQDFRQCNLEWTNFISADLTGANLAGASLKAAKLKDANLSGAILTDANMQYANFSEAMCDLATLMPDGWRCRDGHPTEAK